MDREELEMRIEIYIFGRYQGQADFRTIERNRKGRVYRILSITGGPKRNMRTELNLDKLYEDYIKKREKHGPMQALEKTLQQVESKL